MPTYVRAPGSDTWHWCRNCTEYPTQIADSITLPDEERPSGGELHSECKAKEGDGNCGV